MVGKNCIHLAPAGHLVAFSQRAFPAPWWHRRVWWYDCTSYGVYVVWRPLSGH